MIPADLVAQAVTTSLSLWGEFARVWDAFGLLLRYSPYWAPPVLAIGFWRVWLRYVRAKFIASQAYVLLELRLPQEIMKSPQAMQAVFDGLWSRSGESTFIDRMWEGKVRVWYSFELVSHEGQVHLYIWTRAAFKRHVERMFYAHYADIEIHEVPDYAVEFPFTMESYNLYGSDYKLAGPIGVPIKTYGDYRLDVASIKEEQKVDPLAHILEWLGAMGKGEHAWIQILCRAHRGVEDMTFGAMRTRKSYQDLAKEEVSRIRKSPEETIVFPSGETGKTLSSGQIERIKAINRNLQQGTYWEVGVRGLYIAEHEHFDGTNISAMLSIWQPFGSPGYNSIVLEGARWQNVLNFPWQDFNDYRQNKMKVQILDAYRQRSWFHEPYKFKPFMLTSEELATIFHLPGSVAATPTMQRIASTRAQAPANLPI